MSIKLDCRSLFPSIDDCLLRAGGGGAAIAVVTVTHRGGGGGGGSFVPHSPSLFLEGILTTLLSPLQYLIDFHALPPGRSLVGGGVDQRLDRGRFNAQRPGLRNRQKVGVGKLFGGDGCAVPPGLDFGPDGVLRRPVARCPNVLGVLDVDQDEWQRQAPAVPFDLRGCYIKPLGFNAMDV